MAKTKKANDLLGMTRVQFGRRYGVFANQVARWIGQGVVVLDADAKVNVAASDSNGNISSLMSQTIESGKLR
jgi:hypothetical protein